MSLTNTQWQEGRGWEGKGTDNSWDSGWNAEKGIQSLGFIVNKRIGGRTGKAANELEWERKRGRKQSVDFCN